jgi:hypothetical protein
MDHLLSGRPLIGIDLQALGDESPQRQRALLHTARRGRPITGRKRI